MEFFKYSDEEIYLLARPIMESMREGTNNNDYELFSRYFSSKMIELVGSNRFTEQTNKNVPVYGELGTQTILGCVRRESGVTVVFRQSTTKKKSELVGQVTLDDEGGKISVINAGLF